MTIHINIDTNPDPDCFVERINFAVYTIYPPGPERWALEWKDEDDEPAEILLCRLFNARREMEGCFSSNTPLPSNYKQICTDNDIIINKIGEQLENC